MLLVFSSTLSATYCCARFLLACFCLFGHCGLTFSFLLRCFHSHDLATLVSASFYGSICFSFHDELPFSPSILYYLEVFAFLWVLLPYSFGFPWPLRNQINLLVLPVRFLHHMSEEVLKSLLMKEKEESEKGGLKLNIQKTKILAPDPITLWQTDGETMETVRDFIFLGSKITAYGDCSHKIKRRLLLRRKAMTNLDSVLKSRDITLPTKVHLLKAVVFPVVMFWSES